MHESMNSVMITDRDLRVPQRVLSIMSGIVIIEDDALMNALLKDCLTEAGYRVSSGAHLDTAAASPDLLIINVYMPRATGAEMLREARAAHPDTPVIAISGQFCSAAVGCAEALGVRKVVPKPFSRDELLDAVRAVIGPPV
jgi:two-component system chemotaxis response regulator CheY